MAANEEYVLQILTESSLVTPKQVEQARSELTGEQTVVEVLISQGLLTEEDVARSLASHAAMDFVDLGSMDLNEELVSQITRDVARRFKVVPVGMNGGALVLAVDDPLNFDTFDALHHLLKRETEFVCATPNAIRSSIERYYGASDSVADALAADGVLGGGD